MYALIRDREAINIITQSPAPRLSQSEHRYVIRSFTAGRDVSGCLLQVPAAKEAVAPPGGSARRARAIIEGLGVQVTED